MISRIRKATAVLTLGASLAGFSVPASAQEVKLIFNTFISHAHIWNADVLFPWLNDLSQATEGRVTFDVPPSTLAPPPAQYTSVVRGTFDGGYINMTFLENFAGLMQISALPRGTFSAEGNSRALWETYQEYFAPVGELDDVHLLALYVGLPGDLLLRDKSADQAGSIKGVKMYTIPGPSAKLMDAARAAVVAAPAVQAYEIISSGTVDAFAGLALFDFEAFNIYQYTKSAVLIPGGLSAPSFALFMNKDRWAEISEADQQAITAIAQDKLQTYVGAYDIASRKALENARAAGIEVIDAPDSLMEQFAPAADAMDEDWIAKAEAKGVDGRAALEFYRTKAREYSEELGAIVRASD
ncbi:hypothetical protein [Paracoccus sp. (in: a-proteobacteria)]|uniref:hypothetical protein n=1 Tax=Paracoccus sp. TaxID=267 RepID=UPI003A895064